MKTIKVMFLFLAVNIFCSPVFPGQEINVFVNVRGDTGIENEVKDVISKEFGRRDMTAVTEDREECHLYVEVSVVEQDPIRFYAIGVSIAYHIRGEFYSRPTSDAAQFGKDRMEEVCRYLVTEIDKAFLTPLRHPAE